MLGFVIIRVDFTILALLKVLIFLTALSSSALHDGNQQYLKVYLF